MNKTNLKPRASLSSMLNKANSSTNKSDEQISLIPVSDIEFDPLQPRKHFDPEALTDLSDSIKSLGLIQPIVVRPKPGVAGKFIITVGERRYRATIEAGLEKIRAFIKDVDTSTENSERTSNLILIQLAENGGRVDLTASEYVLAVGELLTDFKLNNLEIAQAIGKSKSRVSEYVTVYQSDKRFIELLESGVKFRPVVELCRLYSKDPEFIASHLDSVKTENIDSNFVNSLKELLDQVDNLDVDTSLDTKEPDVDLSLDTKEPDVDLSLDTKEPDVDLSLDIKEPDVDLSFDTKEPETEFSETYIDGHKNLDLTGSFKKRLAAQAVVHVEFNCGGKGKGRGVIAATYLPTEPHLLPIELDDGSILSLAITDCKIIGYE
jgi:ParB/RepB/Spo0J family partition protein